MRKKKGGIRMDAAVNLKEQSDIKTLLYVLGSNEMKKEQQEVETLVDYLESMGSQFSQMLEELQAVRKELVKMQDKGVRAAVSRIAEKAENRTQVIWGRISMIGKNLVRSAKNAVTAFKEKGVDALRKAVSAMKIPQVLSTVKSMMHHGAEKMNGKAEKTQMLAQELYQVKEHRRNIGRILTGRRAKEPMEQVADKGILAKVQGVFLTCGKIYVSMEQKAERALNHVEKFCRGTEKKTSVKADLKQLKNPKTEKKSVQLANQEQTR